MTMKKLIAVLLGIMTATSPCSAAETPRWYKWASAGIIVGATSLFLNKEASRWNLHARSEQSEGDRIFAEQENKYGQSYQARAQDRWGEARGLKNHGRQLKSVAIGLAVISVTSLGLGVTYGAQGLMVKKSVRFQ
jgi:hypothetical protein